MADKLFDMVVFVRIVEAGSLSGAARHLGLSLAVVSRTLARLEARLGVRLANRTTRTLSLTEEGSAFHARCVRILADVDEAEIETTRGRDTASGLLRISVASPYGHYRVLPLLPRFRERYPRVQIDIHLSNRNIDFAGEDFDLAIRGRTPPDSSLIARKLEDAELVLVAAPSYIARAGKPDMLSALTRHDCVHFVLPSTGQSVPWLFRHDGRDIELSPPASYRCSDDYLGTVILARQGAGLLQTYRYIVQEDLAQGRLQELLPEAGGRSRPFSLIYPNRHHTALRVRALIDFLLAELASERRQ